MKIGILTNEYPPNVYGGAGVHVEYLTKELAALDGGKHTVKILCFGKQRSEINNLLVTGVDTSFNLPVKDHRHTNSLIPFKKTLLWPVY